MQHSNWMLLLAVIAIPLLAGVLLRIGWVIGYHIMTGFRLSEPLSKVVVEGSVETIHLGQNWYATRKREIR